MHELKNTLAMTGAELQELLNKHCEEIRHELSGFLFYGILSCADGTTLAKASGNDEVSKLIEQGSAFHLTIINQIKQVVSSIKTLGTLELDFVLIETNKITFMMMVSGQGKFFSITALDREKANLGIARALITRTKKEYGDMLDSFF